MQNERPLGKICLHILLIGMTVRFEARGNFNF